MKIVKIFGGLASSLVGIYSLQLPILAVVPIMMTWGSQTSPIPITEILTGLFVTAMVLLLAFLPAFVLFSLAYRLLNDKPRIKN